MKLFKVKGTLKFATLVWQEKEVDTEVYAENDEQALAAALSEESGWDSERDEMEVARWDWKKLLTTEEIEDDEEK
jgi:hypothetical protein